MMIKDIQARAGSMWSYVNYIFLVFCWYFLDNWFTSIRAGRADLTENSLLTLLDWALRLVIVPLLFAGVYGGMYIQQRSQEEWGITDFFHGLRAHTWRFLGVNFLSIVIFTVVSIIVVMARGVSAAELDKHKLLAASLSIPYSMINLFWLAAIVVERKIFRGLFQALQTLLLNPFALLIALLWGVISFADTTGIDFPRGQFSLAIDALRAAVLAVARVSAISYAFAFYSKVKEGVPESQEPSAIESAPTEDGIINASFGFTFVSFLPLLHLVALILGILALKRRKQFVLKAAVACCLGGFFTLYYALMIAGLLVSRAAPSLAPGYTFLTDANSALQPQVVLLEQGSFQKVQQQLERNPADPSERPWTVDTALALAKSQTRDLAGSLEEFRIAAKKNPERGEFYYYYGVVLLKDAQNKQAAEQFQTALIHEPELKAARQYADLLNSTYKPSQLVSGLLYVFILMILFTLHEYGHAFAAWKLGDDTAEKQGRLTLNPIPHLDLFGSILLPALLLFQGSEFVFGWARPVPVDPRNFKNPQKDHMLVSFAGPAMNLIIAMISLLILSGIMLVVHLFWPQTMSLGLARPFSPISLSGPPFSRWLILLVLFLKQLFYTSLVLGCFNLLPIPPLDGSWILSGWLPQGLRNIYERIRQFGFVILILLMWTSVFDYILVVPITLSWGALQLLISAMGFA